MHLTLQRNYFLLIIISGLLSLGGQSLAYSADSKVSPSATDTESQASSDEEIHDTKDLEKLLKRYNTDAKKVLEDSSKIETIQDASTSEVNELDIEKMKPSEAPSNAASVSVIKKLKGTFPEKRKEAIPSNLSSSVRLALEPMQKLSEKDLLKRLDESTKSSAVRPYMDKFPNVPIFAVRLIKDKESIPSMVKILENRERLIEFAGIMIGTIIFGFILKRVMHREGRSFIKSAFYFILRMYIIFAIRVFIVYYFFSTELTPAAKIFKQTFMS
jgi:hypothetical protein